MTELFVDTVNICAIHDVLSIMYKVIYTYMHKLRKVLNRKHLFVLVKEGKQKHVYVCVHKDGAGCLVTIPYFKPQLSDLDFKHTL